MEKIKVTFRLKNCKKVPVKVILTFLVAMLLFFVLLYELVNTPSLANISQVEILVDDVVLKKVSTRIGRTTEVRVFSGETTYYIRYPSTDYLDYRSAIESELLSGNIDVVHGTILDEQKLTDRVTGKVRLVDLRSDSSVYYDISTEKFALQIEYGALAVILILYALGFFLGTFLVGINYKIIIFKKR